MPRPIRRPRPSSLALLTLLALVLLLDPVPTAVAGAAPAPDTATTGTATGTPDPVGSWPLRPVPEVVGAFDPPTSPWGAGHRGVDLLGRPGQVVRSALPGTVSYAGILAGRGVVVVSHGATRTTYEPVDATSGPTVGDRVEAGERLGVLEAAPSHCAPRSCLHWGWLAGTTYLDPLRLVGLGPVRLLPFLDAPPVAASARHPVTAGRPWPVAPLAAPPVPTWW